MATIYVVDDDAISIQLAVTFLREAGHTVWYSGDSRLAWAEIVERRPDCAVVDLMMPDIDGFELISRLRADPTLDTTKIIVLSGKPYEADKNRATLLGANAYLQKPVAKHALLGELACLLADRVDITYWGVRGTLPVTGTNTLRYGGNTSCVTVSTRPDHYFILDAGTGLRRFSDHLMEKPRRITGRVLVSHPHLDHVLGLPFFVPFYKPGNEFTIFGCPPDSRGMRAVLSGLMQDPYFPVTMREFGSNLYFHNLREESLVIDDAQVDTLFLQHPGYCLGYRLQIRGHRICYVTDQELFDKSAPDFDTHYYNCLVKFVSDADILITDATYRDAEYPKFRGWGHSSSLAVATMAHDAGVRLLHLFHHDPSQTDDDIDAKRQEAMDVLAKLGSSTQVAVPAEGETVTL